ncbi:IS66 family transposase [Sulfobacillus thermosulfidooxidans]|uniref:IS66 family transposase n=1 Tax=Sulfobacillus thermosulfidooxidans TaxID=28034 RepID=UPI0006B5EDC3|nr:IS66 family transposase [Sulfobacillus thermosulfidooxidans]
MTAIPERSSREWATQVAHLEQQIPVRTAKVEWYESQLRLAVQRRFAASAERSDVQPWQLFNEAEAEATQPIGPATETLTDERKKRMAGQRDAQLKHLPVERRVYRLPDAEQSCDSCHGPLHVMSSEVRRELEIIPAQVKVIEHEQLVYSCRQCEREALTTPIKTAPMPRPVYPGSLASPSLLAEVLHQKFTESLPLYRQEQEWARLGVPLSRQTLANWVIYAAHEWFQPLYTQLQRALWRRDILQADETTVQVLHEDGRAAQQKSYMWLYRTGSETPAIVLYDYQPSRSGDHPKAFLAGFRGYLQVDGYSGYHDIPDVVLVGCWSHARRKFMEALKSLPAAQRDGPHLVRDGLEFCNQLFAIERDLRNASPEERQRARRARSRPVLARFLWWLRAQRQIVLPKSGLGQAVSYCLNQWDALTNFLRDGRLAIDNNRSERSIKPFVIGRKNWQFANTARGARASAIIYSIVETAKENGLNPRAYLQYVLEQLPQRNLKDPTIWDDLWPWSPALPDSLKAPRRHPVSDR